MRPLDPRMMRLAPSARRFVAIAAIIGAVVAALVILQAWLVSSVIVDVTSRGMTWSAVVVAVVVLGAAFGGRAVLAWLAESTAVRASAEAKQQIRELALRKALIDGPASALRAPDMAILLTRGLDGLDGYFARYLPQLVLAIAVPIAIVLTMLGQDLLSALILILTLPLIPVFMMLIGWYTAARVERQWQTLTKLSGHFLDLIAGLPTLKLFNRARAQAQTIQRMGEQYRETTIGVLRITFLSSLALELLASLSVALIAVSIGIRLAEGRIDYRVALFVLLLAPEAYLPLRLVGQHFHAAAEGLGAADRVFALLDSASSSTGSLVGGPVTIQAQDLQISYSGVVPSAPVSFVARPGTVTALVGPSGVGKSTFLVALLGFLRPARVGVNESAATPMVLAGDLHANGVPVADLDGPQWREAIGWVPQSAHLIDGEAGLPTTVSAAIRLGRPTATESEIWAILDTVGIAAELRSLPEQLNTPINEGARGLSTGQLQRIAVARALIRRPSLLLLDEPTSGLDPSGERAVVSALRAAADSGCTVIVVAHRPALIAAADAVVRMERSGERFTMQEQLTDGGTRVASVERRVRVDSAVGGPRAAGW